MTDTVYGKTLAAVYDVLNADVDYDGYADFIEECIRRYAALPVKSVCEIACGTGSLSLRLAGRGYHVTASDLSEDMLTFADMKARDRGADIRFVLQDMRVTAMYHVQDLFVCMLDGLNYLLKSDDIESTLRAVYANLAPGGLFVFDMNSRYKFENVYADNAYVLEDEGVYCGWENDYHEKSRVCDFYLSLFIEDKDGRYTRTDEHQREKLYTIRQMTSLIKKAGFTLCGVFGSRNFAEADEMQDERLYYVLRREADVKDE